MCRYLFLDAFIRDPLSQPTCLIYGREEKVLGETYAFLQSKMEKDYPKNRTRPFVQVTLFQLKRLLTIEY